MARLNKLCLFQVVDLSFLLTFDFERFNKLICFLSHFLFLFYELFLGDVEFFGYAVVTNYKLAMCIVHSVEFSLEFQPELHFFLMVLSVLSVFFLQFET